MSDSFSEFCPASTELQADIVRTSSTCSSQGSRNIEDDSNSSFNGHTIKETTDPDHAKLIHAYLTAKAKYESALEALNHAKGLNWLGRAVWSSLAQIGIGKSRSVKHCQQKLEEAIDNYDAAGVALTQHSNFSRYCDREGFVDHDSLNNQVSYSRDKIQIGVNRLPMNGSYKVGAILRHEIDQYDTQLRSSATIDPWKELRRDTTNGTWKIERDDQKNITSISYDDTPLTEENTSANIDEVIAGIREFAGPNEDAQKAAAYALHPNSFALIATIKTQLPNDPKRLIKNIQGLKSIRQLDNAGSSFLKTIQERKNFRTVLTKNAQFELTINAFQKTENDYLTNCNEQGDALKENDKTTSFTNREEDSFTRTIKLNRDSSASIQTSFLLLKYNLCKV